MLKKIFYQFLYLLLLFSICLIISQIIVNQFRTDILSQYFFIIISYFVVISSSSHYLLLNTLIKKPKKFINIFMLTTTIKLILSFVLLIIFVFTNKDEAKIFILNFAILYLFYLFFDIIMILKQSKQINNL